MSTEAFSDMKLNNHNYFMWKCHMEFYLKLKKLWNIINDKSQENDEQWKSKDRETRIIIEESIEDDQFIHINNKTRAADMWQALKAIHDCTNFNRSDAVESIENETGISFVEKSIREFQLKLNEIQAKLNAIFEEVIEIRHTGK